jgi:hypothetical protein
MKNIAFLLMVIFLFPACSSTREMSSTKAENRKQKKLAEQAEIKKAVESRKYIIKVDRFFAAGGRRIDLIPRSNFVIINGEFASISLLYMGRSYTVRPISGINFNGHTVNYKMESDDARGTYKIRMVVQAGNDKFDVFMTIGNEGSCNVSLNNSYIQSANYTGTLEPFSESKKVPVEKGDRI